MQAIQPQKTYAAATVSKHLRIPAKFQDQLINGKIIATAPVIHGQFDVTNDVFTSEHGPNAVFASRLNEAYEDAAAMVCGERHYLLKALAHANNVMIIRTAGKDPLLIASNWQKDPITSALQNRITFADDATHNLDVPNLGVSDLKLYLAQQLVAGSNPLMVPGAEAHSHKYKKYMTVAVPKTAIKAKSMAEIDPAGHFMCIPRMCVTTSKAASVMLTLQLERDADAATVAPKLFGFSDVRYGIIKNNGAIRLVMAEEFNIHGKDYKESIKSFGLAVGGVRAIVIESTGERILITGDPRVTISAIDGSPLAKKHVELISKHFNMRDVKQVDGFMIGRVTMEFARQLHGARICGTYLGFCQDLAEAKPSGDGGGPVAAPAAAV